MIDPFALRPQLVRIAREAGDAILTLYNRNPNLTVTQKDDQTPVTEADLAAHRLILTSLTHLTPDIPVLSEESAPEERELRHQWRRYWLVDPLDGTKEFINRNGEFTVNIALIDNGEPALGVVHVPVGGATYSGCRHQGAFKQKDGQREVAIRTRPLNRYRPIDVVVSRSHADPRLADYLAPLKQVAPLSTIGIGSSLKLCLIAEGLADLHVRLGPTSEWDTAAAQAVLESAGGRVCDLTHQPLRYNQRESILNPDFCAYGDAQFNWGEYLQPIAT